MDRQSLAIQDAEIIQTKRRRTAIKLLSALHAPFCLRDVDEQRHIMLLGQTRDLPQDLRGAHIRRM